MSNETGERSIYTVQIGDSLWDIANKFNTTVERLKEINNLSTERLQPGMTLSIPSPKQDLNSNTSYSVQPGDSLWSIANKFNVTTYDIKRVNNIKSDNLKRGQTLIIPISLEPDIKTFYRVKQGDSLWNISRQFNISPEQLKDANDLNSNSLMPGQTLIIPTTSESNTETYVVRDGDSLWSIASRFDMTVEDLKELNNLVNNDLNPGEVLKIKSDSSTLIYTVKQGDSLWSIANYYGMSVKELKALNNIDTDNLEVGQTLTVIKRQASPEITTIIYTVDEGDSLWEIANRFGSTVEHIKSLNSLTSNSLQIGQKLTLSKNVKPTDANIMVRVKRYNGNIDRVSLEEYVTGVVSSELSAGFNHEAYKAQALAARTYAVKRIREGKVLSDTASHQVYKDQQQLKDWWGDEFEDIYKKIRLAVSETKGEVITYNDDLIDALFFSTSNGRTENPKNVWGGELPYLRSVDSRWDTKSPHYYDAKVLSYSQFRSRLGLSSNSSLYANIVSRTSGGSVDRINISGSTFTGEQVRKRLALKSTDFDIKFANGNAKIRQRGWGHQVGLSQYGSHYMGEEGYNYRQIINHYYPGVAVTKLI
ncbi:stage II sporulation protein D [Haloplasma contractile]|uniref:Stage II sporulation protein D n=1 Tax=Haloplasma contractile SSD-17B TaxID=1033810 RepID=U2EDR9_9MOLU|nr:stage II sporulation protein D [Haloplasma contractile]ERJ13133.1 Stage II sporulation protein D [Haloplasma contractile SSD-17B]